MNFFTCLIIVFLLPTFKKAIPPIIGFWLLTWLLEFNYSKRFADFGKNWKIFALGLLFFIIHIIGLSYTENLDSGYFDIEVKLTLFLFPVVFAGANFNYKRNLNLILATFVAGNILASGLCLFHAFYDSTNFVDGSIKFNPMIWVSTPGLEGYSNAFFYFVFSRYIHSTYFAMYLVFCITILLYFIENHYLKSLRKLHFATILFFLIIIYLLSSRAGIISAFVVLLGYVSIKVIKHKKIIPGLVVFSVLLLFAILVAKFNMRLGHGVEQLKKTSFNTKDHEINTSNDRLQIWFSSSEIIKKNIIAGVGTGDVKDALNQCYKKDHLNEAIKGALNAHNQFLETFIGLGLTGIVLLLSILLLSFVKSVKSGDMLLSNFIIIVALNFMFESMLNTQSGVVFFAIFFYLLSFHSPLKHNSMK